MERLLRDDPAVAAATAAHLRAVNARERREETLEALKKPAKGSKVVDGKEQNRAFVERSLGKLASDAARNDGTPFSSFTSRLECTKDRSCRSS